MENDGVGTLPVFVSLGIYGRVIDSKESQPLNASLPIEVTVFGRTIFFKDEHPSKAPSPMDSKPLFNGCPAALNEEMVLPLASIYV